MKGIALSAPSRRPSRSGARATRLSGAAALLVVSIHLAAAAGAAPAFAQSQVGSSPEAAADAQSGVESEFTGELGVPAAAIPEGRDDFFAEMFGRGETLPGNCRFSGGQVDRHEVVAVYACGDGEVVYELSHPDKAPLAVPRTVRFALALRDGTPPSGLEDALLARIRSREAAFEWIWPRNAAVQPRRIAIVPIAAAVLGAIALALVLRRRRRSSAAR